MLRTLSQNVGAKYEKNANQQCQFDMLHNISFKFNRSIVHNRAKSGNFGMGFAYRVSNNH